MRRRGLGGDLGEVGAGFGLDYGVVVWAVGVGAFDTGHVGPGAGGDGGGVTEGTEDGRSGGGESGGVGGCDKGLGGRFWRKWWFGFSAAGLPSASEVGALAGDELVLEVDGLEWQAAAGTVDRGRPSNVRGVGAHGVGASFGLGAGDEGAAW